MIDKRGAAMASVAAAVVLAVAPPAMARDHHHHRHYHHHRDRGNVGAGIAGFAAGAILGGALASHEPYYGYQRGPSYRAQVRWCMRHYRSYDLRSRTYLGYDGRRHSCP